MAEHCSKFSQAMKKPPYNQKAVIPLKQCILEEMDELEISALAGSADSVSASSVSIYPVMESIERLTETKASVRESCAMIPVLPSALIQYLVVD